MNKSETKFQIGDHVVVVREDDPHFIGATGVVIEDDNIPYVRLDDKSLYDSDVCIRLDRTCFNEEDLELTILNNSPLWKALS